MLSLPVVRPARYQANTACPHYAESDRPTCRRLTDRVGRFVLATGPLCSLHCPTVDEPTMLRRVARLAFEPHFLAKTWAKETTPPVYHVPAIWPAIRAALTPLRERPDVLAVYLTGSAIVAENDDPKDVDVAIVVRDLAAFKADATRHDLMPKTIDGRWMDYFVWSQPSHPFFPALDADDHSARLIAPTHRPRPYSVSGALTIDTPAVDPVLDAIYAEIAAEALAYPQQHHPAARACATPRTPSGWPAVHRLADLIGVTREQVRDQLERMVAGFPRRQSRLQEYLDRQPIDMADVDGWLHQLHNTANAQAGKPTLTLEQARAQRRGTKMFTIHNTATGLGDAVCGLYVACGLADATGRPVLYRSHSAAWLTAAAEHPGVTIEPIESGKLGPDMNAGWDGYVDSINTADSRTQRYCDNVAAALAVEPFTPKRPAHVRRDEPV